MYKRQAKKRTISIEVGMQNAGLATVLAGNFFAAQPLAVLPVSYTHLDVYKRQRQRRLRLPGQNR